MNILFEKHNNLLSNKREIYYREVFDSFEIEEGRMIGIVGPRGIGKTSYLLDYAEKYENKEQILYISADDPYFVNKTLTETVKDFINYYNGEVILIDEIHKYKDWDRELKNIYDFYPQLKVIFSGSSSIDLIKGKYDLSHRVLMHHLQGFSFREYLEFKLNLKLKSYSLNNLVENRIKIARELSKIPKLLAHFNDYLEIGYYPFAFEFKKKENTYIALENVIDKAIYEDIALFYKLKTHNLYVFKKLLFYFATAAPSEVNINKLANSLEVDNKTIVEYLQILHNAGFVRFLKNDKVGYSFVRSLEKIYLDNLVLFFGINHFLGKSFDRGALKEIFALNQLQNSNNKVFYAKNGDFKINEYVFEIGGKNKTKKQIRGIEDGFLLLDNVLYGDARVIPLYLLGFLY